MKYNLKKFIACILVCALAFSPAAGIGLCVSAEKPAGVRETEDNAADCGNTDVYEALENKLEMTDCEYDGFIVKMKDQSDEAGADRDEYADAAIEETIEEIDQAIDDGAAVEALEFVDGTYAVDDIATIKEVFDEEAIEYIEPDYIVRMSEAAGTQTADVSDAAVSTASAVEPDDFFYADDQYNLKMLNVPTAWSYGMEGQDLDASIDMDNNGDPTDERLVIAVIDSGIKTDHEDIDASRIVEGRNFTENSSGTVVPDDIYDIYGHGTQVAGIMMAKKDNSKGIAGILQKADVMPVRVFRETNETTASVLCNAVGYAVEEKEAYDESDGTEGANVSVINMSLGATGLGSRMQTMMDLCDQAVEDGIIVVCAAGNVTSRQPQFSAQYPAQFTMGVGSVDKDQKWVSISLWLSEDNGPGFENKVWVTAPGDQVITLGAGARDDYWYMSGTSFACPHVSALALFCKSLKNDMTQTEFMALLKATAMRKSGNQDKINGQDIQYGWGIVDFKKAIDSLRKSRGYTTPMKAIYRLYNPKSKEHLWTSSKNEYNVLAKSYGWRQEGIGWHAPLIGDGVYRLYNPTSGDHHYTSDVNEVNVLTARYGWRIDNNGNPIFYSGGYMPVYRVYNKKLQRGSHHFTKSLNEYNTLPNYGWKQEGIAFYCEK